MKHLLLFALFAITTLAQETAKIGDPAPSFFMKNMNTTKRLAEIQSGHDC